MKRCVALERAEAVPIHVRSTTCCVPLPHSKRTQLGFILTCTNDVISMQLEKALNRPTSDRNDAILSAMKEVSDANQYLIKLEHLPTAINALARNRQSLARAVSHCSSTYDRTMKTCSLVPNAATVENVLSSPPESVHHQLLSIAH